MIISGSCWDVTTGLDLKTHITARVEGGAWMAHHTDANGLFSIQVPSHTQQLTFDIIGYETVVFPVTALGEMDRNTRFRLSIPVIRKDSQLLVGTYNPPPKQNPKSVAKGTSFFRVRNAHSGIRLQATVCLKYPNTGRAHCFEVDSTKVPTGLALARSEAIAIEVNVSGYQSYRGSITASPDGLENQLYQIRLLPLNHTILALAYEVPENQQFRYEIRKPGHSTFVSSFTAPIPYLSSNSVRPDEDYQLTIYDKGNQLVRQETFTIKPGLNFKTIRLKKPAASTPAASIMHRDYATYDSVVLYFDQSTYHLRQATQPTLDSISWLLARQPGLRAHLTGHTDNVGQRALNQTLSEYRARVVAHYLKQRGVAPEQLVPTGRGPDSPAAPNDSEVNKAKNRRVVVRLQP